MLNWTTYAPMQAVCQPNASCNSNCVCPAATHTCFGAGMQVCKVRWRKWGPPSTHLNPTIKTM